MVRWGQVYGDKSRPHRLHPISKLVTDQFRNFGTPLYIFGMTKGRNFTFGAHIDYDMYYPLHNKLTPKVDVVRVT